MLNRRCEKLPVNYRDSLLSADGRLCFEIDLLIGSPLYWILRAKDLKLFLEEFYESLFEIFESLWNYYYNSELLECKI